MLKCWQWNNFFLLNSNNINTELATNILFEIRSVVVHIWSYLQIYIEKHIYLCDTDRDCVYNKNTSDSELHFTIHVYTSCTVTVWGILTLTAALCDEQWGRLHQGVSACAPSWECQQCSALQWASRGSEHRQQLRDASGKAWPQSLHLWSCRWYEQYTGHCKSKSCLSWLF